MMDTLNQAQKIHGKKGSGMKSAVDATEEIRKWVS